MTTLDDLPLRDDLRVSADTGRANAAPEFEREELLKPLEAWFFGRSQAQREQWPG